MPIQLGKTAEGDYTNPIGLLGDCHRRIERFLDTLSRLVKSNSELDDDRRKALVSSLKYFREAAPRHTADEEESLFPRLRGSASAEAQSELNRIDTLHAEHIVVDALHKRVEEIGQRWLSQGSLSGDDLSQIRQALQQLSVIYQQHILLEESTIFTLASRVLNKEQVESIGREMASRRGLDFDKLTCTTTSL